MKSAFEPGQLIADRYRVERMLGRGGMGIVYLVVDRLTDQRLALKTLLPRYATNKYAVHRFVREVTVVRQLNHPCIVRIYEAQRVGKLLYYTMEYVEGKGLREWLQQRGRLGIGSTVRILSLICHALEHAHQYTIHRDLSPDNVMVLRDGSVKLLDFGLAKLTTVDAAFTRVGVSLGKYQYNAPEQRLNAADVDHRADLYSLGVMFFELLTGEIPRGVQRITELRPDLPKACDSFVEKAMAQSPDDRFADAREFRLALVDLYDQATAQAEQPAQEAAQRTWRGWLLAPWTTLRNLAMKAWRKVWRTRGNREEK